MSGWSRRRLAWLALALTAVLGGGTAYALRDAASGPAGPGRGGITEARAIAPVLAPAAQRSPAALRLRSAAAGSRAGRSTAVARSSRVRPGVPTPPASGRGVSQALREATGLGPAQVTSRAVCPRPAAGHVTCAAQALVLRTTGAPVHPHVAAYRSLGRVKPALGSGAHPATSVAAVTPPPAFTPAYLQQAYDLSALSQTAGTGDTVAVVDAFDDTTAASDLSTFRSKYSLPACSTSPCFRKVNQTGMTSPLPPANAAWAQEIALDLDAVSSVCPNCHILLVEANSTSFSDLEAAMQTAAGTAGVKQISASWWGISNGVPAGFRTFAGVATVAATGDAGYPGAGEDNYPAALPGVTAAGGTSLAPAAAPGARGFGESAWSWNGQDGGGSGCDLQFSRPSYQPAQGCDGRAYADLSADADPNTGLSVYNHGVWSLIGGTSLSTPMIAAYYAVTGVAGATPAWAYGASSALNDITAGSTGLCAASIAYICNAGTGYDGPTGVGSVSGSVAVGAPGIGGPSISSSNGNTYTASVSAHGATINAGIYRNGLDTTWSIQYGTTTSYGSQTTPIDIGAGAAPVTVTGYLSQLVPGTPYHYRLVATNSKGTTYGYDYTLNTQPAPAGAPVAAFTASPSTAPPGTPVTFNASASTPGTGGSISDFSWNFGDGTTFDAQTSATTPHTYTTRGTYTVTLTITSNGQSDTSTQTVTIDTPPTASFTPSASAVPDMATVALDASASTPSSGGSITDYSWSFGDGSAAQDTGGGAHASHKYSAPGTYTVTLTTTDDLDVSSKTTQRIVVAPFTVSQAAPGNLVTFTAVNPPVGTTLSWDFGDGGAGSGSPATHTYANRGAPTVTLTIQNGTTSSKYTAKVVVDTPPTSSFTPSPTAVRPGATVQFDGSASRAAKGGSITDYTWDFGDGSPAQDTAGVARTSHVFPTPGVYTVTLTTTDDLGVTASSTEQVTADEPGAVFSSSVTGTAPAASVSFDASSTSDPESSITDYSWNFGDGTSADAGASANEAHVYTTAGTYTVTLTVTNQLGLTDTTSGQIVIAPASVQSTGGPPPVTTPTPTPTPSPSPVSKPTTSPLVAKLTGAGRQRLTVALAHGFRLAVSANQAVRAGFQITVPFAETKQAGQATHGTKRSATVVLLRASRTFPAGGHFVTLKLSHAAAGRLASTGRLVLTVRVTLRNTAGKTVTRTLKITLTR